MIGKDTSCVKAGQTSTSTDPQSNEGLQQCSSSSSPPSAISQHQLVKGSERPKNDPTSPQLESGDLVPNERHVTNSIFFWVSRCMRGMLKSRLAQPGQKYSSKDQITDDIRKVQEYSPGYDRIAAFLATDPIFLMVRKFEWMRIRALLYLQEELQELEVELEAYNERKRATGEDATSAESQRTLMCRILGKIEQYDALLFRTRKTKGMKRPQRRDQDSVHAFIVNDDDMQESEVKWIRRSDDLGMASMIAENPWLNGFVEDAIAKVSRRLSLTLFSTLEGRIKSGDIKELFIISPERVNAFIHVIIALLATVELLVPSLINYRLQQSTNAAVVDHVGYYQFLTIFLSTLCFIASASIFSTVQRKDVFAIIAGYCAVQVVFLGASSNAMVGPSAGV